MVGYLWLSIKSLDDYINEPIIQSKRCKGICDTLKIASEEIQTKLKIKNYYGTVISEIDNLDFDAAAWKKTLMDVFDLSNKVDKNNKNIVLYWNSKLKTMVQKCG